MGQQEFKYLRQQPRQVLAEESAEPQEIIQTVQEAINDGEITVTSQNIKSGSQPANKVLATDGSGDSEWKSVTQAIDDELTVSSVNTLIGFDEQGRLCTGSVPAGSVVDAELDPASENPVQNKAIAVPLLALQDDVADAYDATKTYQVGEYVLHDGVLYKCSVEISAAEAWNSAHWTEANVTDEINGVRQDLETGELVPSKALTAKELEPVSDESGTIQETPFISQGTATANGTSATPTGPVGKQLEKQGNALVANQKFDKSKILSSDSGTGYSWAKNADNSITITVTDTIQQDSSILLTSNVSNAYAKVPVGHRFFYTTHNPSPNICFRDGFSGLDYPSGTGTYVKANDTANILVSVKLKTGLTAGTYKVDTDIVDLTQMFDGAVPPDLVSYPDNFFRYYNGSMAYNAGSLEVSNGRYLVCTKRNLWDEQTESGMIDSSTGQNAVNVTAIRSKNYIRLVPNVSYHLYRGGSAAAVNVFCYDKDKTFISYLGNQANVTSFEVPSNCEFVRLSFDPLYGTNYRKDITISLYYPPEEGGEGYNQHYDYEEPKVYDTGSETLRKAGSVKDVKLPDGTIIRRVGVQDLSQLSWNYSSGGFFYANLTGIKPVTSGDDIPNIDCAKYIRVSTNNLETPLSIFQPLNLARICINDDNYDSSSIESFVSSLSGLTLFYELAEYTTEQGTPFSENIEIDDYGMMYWLDTDGNLVSIPQGTKLFYVAWYAGFVDDMYKLTDGDGTNVLPKTVKVDDVMESLPANAPESLKQVLDLIAANHAVEQANAGGMLRHQLVAQVTAAGGTLDFADTKYIDLGDLSYSTSSSGDSLFFYATLNDVASNTSNILCPLYKVGGISSSNTTNMVIAVDNGTQLRIRNIAYTDAAAFEAAMKGMLLAYEKASE